MSDYIDEDTTEDTMGWERAVKDAAAKGCKIVLPEPNQLFVDIDSQATYEHFINVGMKHLRRIYPDAGLRIKVSPSEEPWHYHATVTLPEPIENDITRIALQAMLGSDPVRELLSWERLVRGLRVPVLFFEKLENKIEPSMDGPTYDEPPTGIVLTE